MNEITATPGRDYSLIVRGAVALLLLLAIVPLAPRIVAYAQHVGFHPHLPDMALLGAIPAQIKLHIVAATTAFLVGLVILLRPKGTGFHKTLGWIWVTAMATTAISSFFITGLNGHNLSIIHLISGWTVVALPMALVAIRRGNVAMHRRTMTGLYVGGLLIAGALTFIPGRLMYQLFFGG